MLLTCNEISKQQPVTRLLMYGVDCVDSSLPALRMINPQFLSLRDCFLLSDYVRSLQQFFGSGDSLQVLALEYMNLRPLESLLDEMLEDLVAHHEAQKGQRKLWLELAADEFDYAKLSKDFIVKWTERCEEVESIDCRISNLFDFDDDEEEEEEGGKRRRSRWRSRRGGGVGGGGGGGRGE